MRIVFLLFVLLSFHNSLAANNTLNLYVWSFYISPETLDEFKKKYHVNINYDVFDSNEMLDAKLMAGKTGYDIVFPSDRPFLKNQIQLGLYHKLDKSKLPNIKNVDHIFLNILAEDDPGNQYAMPWFWALTGLGVNKQKILEIDPNAPLDSFEILFNPEYAKKFAKCGINMMDSATEIIPLALIYNGFDPNSENFDELNIAKDTLKAIAPYIKTFNSSSYDDSFVDGSICLSVAWSGDMLKAEEKLQELKKPNNLKFILPKEGFLMAIDTMTIPIDAPNIEDAHKFINFLMDPKIAAQNSNYTRYFNANKSSYPYIDPLMKNNRPDEKTIARGYRISPQPPKILRKINRIWTSFLTDN